MSEVAVAQHRIFGIAGDEQDFQVRALCAGGVCHLPSVHAPGQAHVCDQEVHTSVGLKDFQPSLAIARLERGVPQTLQDIRHEHPYRRLVVDHQNGLALSRTRREIGFGFSGVGLLRLAQISGEIKTDHRTLAELGVNPRLATGLTGEAVNHRKP